MITPVVLLVLGSFITSPSYWTIYRSFEIILEWELSINRNSSPGLYANLLLQRNIQSNINNIFKTTKLRMGVRALADEPERSASEQSLENAYYERHFLIQVTCNMGAKGQA